jgi:hypothetical protein
VLPPAEAQCVSSTSSSLKHSLDRYTRVLQSMKLLRWHVRFTFERTGLQLMQQALQNVQLQALEQNRFSQRFLFPDTSMLSSSNSSGSSGNAAAAAAGQPLVWVNERTNELQRRAVTDIVLKAHQSVPYIIFGPPGASLRMRAICFVICACEYVLCL